ncbi:MAG: phosphopantothenoylcysteine synthase [Candidatus Xiphinematobacter sp.]|nr:MAG: phosphopantothenoylcysteine synthase [Candidatus Xiphinematobacter sp.]
MRKFSQGQIIVTCGPAFEPIDAVRRITNFSTGELGTLLCNHLTEKGWEVFCLRGTGATYPRPAHANIFPFSTNMDLEKCLNRLSELPSIVGVFHAAALCDFRVVRVENSRGVEVIPKKLGSRSGSIHLTLEPTPKIVRKLRGLFPHSYIVGWKYELKGLSKEAISIGYQQITESATDACIVNGPALGGNFVFLGREDTLLSFPTKMRLCLYLNQWLSHLTHSL